MSTIHNPHSEGHAELERLQREIAKLDVRIRWLEERERELVAVRRQRDAAVKRAEKLAK